MTQKTCFCHLMSKQTTPKDMQYDVMPEKKSRLNCANWPHLTNGWNNNEVLQIP